MTEPQKKILIVDDEVSICNLLKIVLREAGYCCDSALNGLEALQKIAVADFDLVLTDINMPQMDGLQLIEQLHQLYPQLAVLISTGVSEREIALKALDMGAYGYLLKPFDDFELLIHIENALRRAELERISQSYQQELEAQVAERTAALKETNRMLRQQEKLASIGQLAAGIAHEINTPVGFVSSNLLSLKKYLPRLLEYLAAQRQSLEVNATPAQQAELKKLARSLKIELIIDDTGELVDNCLDGAQRIKSIIQGLKDFSRMDQVEAGDFDLNKVITDSLLLVSNELKCHAEVECDLKEIPRLSGYQQRLGQVFINLLVNAAQAIKARGIIKISTQLENGQVIARVADDGGGIPAENLQKIFEPFYTTKEIGIGTGLGLSIIKDIVAQHQGWIEVESKVGKGTVFTLGFPVVEI